MELSMFAEDFSHFFNEDEFATRAAVRLRSGAAHADIVGIFDDPYLNAQLGEYEVDTSQPRFLTTAFAVRHLAPGDSIVVSGRSYDLVTHPQPDGTGLAVLKLAPGEPSA